MIRFALLAAACAPAAEDCLDRFPEPAPPELAIEVCRDCALIGAAAATCIAELGDTDESDASLHWSDDWNAPAWTVVGVRYVGRDTEVDVVVVDAVSGDVLDRASYVEEYEEDPGCKTEWGVDCD